MSGVLLTFALVGFVIFVSAAPLARERAAVLLIGGLAGIDGLANGGFVFAHNAGLHVPLMLHWLNGMLCAVLLSLAAIRVLVPHDAGEQTSRLALWPLASIFSGAFVGGAALLIGLGRFEWAAYGRDNLATAQSSIVVVLIGLAMMAAGAGAVAAAAIRWRIRGRAGQALLTTATLVAGGLLLRTAVANVEHGTRATEPPLAPWSTSFWILLLATLVLAATLGAAITGDPGDHAAKASSAA
jgi:hypothetical protein